MKVAVASSDGVTIADHFGRSTCLLVFEICAGQVAQIEKREGTFASKSDTCCEVKQSSNGSGQEHDYSEIVHALADCRAVLCRGMGWHAAQQLVRSGINPLVIQGELSPRDAVQRYIEGGLKPAGGFCRNTGRPAPREECPEL